MIETEVSHGSSDCADVERIARGDKDDVETIALGLIQHVICKKSL